MKPILTSNFEYVVEPAKLCMITSNVGALCWLQIHGLHKFLGCRYTLRVPLDLQG